LQRDCAYCASGFETSPLEETTTKSGKEIDSFNTIKQDDGGNR
jgi:hypothetical protein